MSDPASDCFDLNLISQDPNVQNLYRDETVVVANSGANKNKIKLKGFGGQVIPVKYVIEWYNALTMQPIGNPVVKWVQPGGKLRLDYPDLSDDMTQYIIAYKIRRQGEPSFLVPNDEPMEQSLSRMIEEVLLTNDLLANETKIRKLEKEEIKEEVTGTNSNNTILQVNPNPTSGSISIEFKGNMKNAKLLIVNSIGKVVLQEQLIKKNVIKDLSGHPKGIYIVTVNKNLC